ncbi:MAG: hypothetical protein MJ136_03400, partial [Clostridia bacterium]|nr:hypothetical protein [Clostridia bacterium]
GCEPYFSAFGAYVFFCSERNNILRYSCSTNECVCIYRVSYTDQLLSYDLYNDQLLVVLNSSSTAEHKGFDTVSINGKIIGSARYNNSIDRWGSSISGKWLDKDHVFLMHASSFNTPYDVIQMLPSNTRGTIDTDAFVTKKEKTAKGLYELYMSPNRSFFAFVWMDAMSFGRYCIEICESKSLKTMSEYQVDFFKSLAFSDDEKQMFVFSDEYIKIELSR